MGKTKIIMLNLDASDRKIAFVIAGRAEKKRARIERNREIIRRLKNKSDRERFPHDKARIFH